MPTFFSYPDYELQQKLKKTADAIVAPGKGILAVDEANEAIGKLLASVGLDNNENNRRRYRQLLFTTDAVSNNLILLLLFCL
ncbi:unnamed protein product [Euphydryas editha]|uniref:fructose-bisphosphate aldolase n=1 Tax=Euphydryas editha TaxID=104508 RepID=A0AAU9U9T5_EUPED|nr:unnamed protein product [Euphydryas editha]